MPISDKARRKILDKLIAIGQCAGTDGRAVNFVKKVAPYYKRTAEVERHMDTFKDWNYDQLFYSELNLLSVTDNQFADFCREYMNPVFQRTQRKQDEYYEPYIEYLNPKCLEAINAGLELADLELVPDSHNEGFYKVRNKIAFPNEPIKNIVFAANRTKPDIVVDNALENSVKIVDAGDALVYKDGISEKGLSWLDLAKWYKQFESEDTENKLAERLFSSLQSEPEKIFFRAYCDYIIKHDRNLPALIPQVYLYYDPKTANARFGRPIFEHQRMDFMFIISREHRVVIEIDGIQHYAEDRTIGGTYYKCADVKRYAEMMRAHREMVLDGYDVYRFGGKELYVGPDKNEEPAKQVVFDFLEGLFRKYRIMPKGSQV